MRLLLSLFSVTALAAAAAAEFPKPFNTGNDVGKAPMPASEAVKLIEMPPGFKATVFAAEPDVQNPIACTWDSRGRLWVAENYTYADKTTNFDKTLRDRILIFEDTDGDGVADKRSVFCENLQNLTSIELGYGGLYATTAPRLVFIPIKPGEDKPAGEPETLLDGFDAWSVRHNIVNGLKWGPDGWLYGRHGIQATSKVGAPGTPDAERTKINCCIWRYHPVRKTFEVVCWGGTNSWGHDWNAEGDGFFINTVIGQLYQIIPGAHYERMYGQDLNPYIYQLLPQTADHYHFDMSKGWTNSRDGKANDLGGGHAHSGCMIYQGDNWPEQYRGKLFTLNLHGRRINCERLEKQGSGYVGKHEPDMIKFGDPWFRGVELTCGPDGGVYVLDWSDDGECHESDGVHRESGRIYKITYGTPRKADLGPEGDLAKLGAGEWMNRALSGSEWSARQARRLLAESAAIGKDVTNRPATFGKAITAAKEVLEDNDLKRVTPQQRLRALLALHAADAMQIHDWDTVLCNRDSTDADEPSIVWAVNLIAENPKLLGSKDIIGALETRAQRNALPHVRLAFASNLGRYSEPLRGTLLGYNFIGHLEDAGDLRMVSVLWNTLQRSPSKDLAYLAGHVSTGKMPEWITRRLASDPMLSAKLDEVLHNAGRYITADCYAPIVLGMADAFKGRIKAAKPSSWDEFAEKASAFPELAGKVRQLNVIFGSGRALEEVRQTALDGKADIATRQQALESLVAANPPDLRATLDALLKDNELLPSVLAALAKFDDAAAVVVSNYGRVRADGKPGVMAALCSRPAFAKALLDAVAAGKIPRTDLTPYHARQIAGLKDPAVSQRLAEVWGSVATTSDQKKTRMGELKRELSPVLKDADVTAGRAVFTQTCAACHTLYDLGQQGANLGPNLTGSGRENLDYLLENIVDPSAVVPADYKLSTLTLKDGRVLSGFISTQTDQTLTLRTMTGTENLPRSEVTKTESSSQSLMPEGLLDALTPQQRRDLFGFLMKK